MWFAGKQPAARSAGFSLIEVMASVAIIAIASGLVIVDSTSTDATTRLDRAGDEVVAALRFARVEAMGHGETVINADGSPTTQPSTAYGVAFDTSANSITVYTTTWDTNHNLWTLPGTAISGDMYPNGNYVINFNTQPELQGVTIASVHLTGTSDTQTNTSSPYICQYLPFGQAENYGSVAAAITLSCDGYTRTISIPQVGDASKN
jgi:prepilin-type N-terminal cleavage/methylation domain-containing protein